MKEISLTQGKIALVDDADFEVVNQFKWYAWRTKSGVWYAQRNVKKSDGTRTIQTLHQFLLPGVPMLDHKDGHGINNQRDNLRPCNKSQNGANSRLRKDGSSDFRGVSWFSRDGKWRAQIQFQTERYHLGYFNHPEDAARAYDIAAKNFHKQFARLNFPAETP